MEIINTTPFKFAPLVSLEAPDEYTLSLIVKGTFNLSPGGTLSPADEQALPSCEQRFDNREDSSLREESDYVPRKPKADVLLVGNCHPPGGQPTASCETTFRVGKWSKSLRVYGNRFWSDENRIAAEITAAQPFSLMPLRYELSFGGVGFAPNPLGKGIGQMTAADGTQFHPLPNIESPDAPLASRRARPAPAGYGPLDRNWPQRSSILGTYDNRWVDERWPCPPQDFDTTFYNAAPADQQIAGYLLGDEELEMQHLHALHANYQTRLPGLRLRGFLHEETDAAAGQFEFREVPLNLDTLQVDMEHEKAALVWRGATQIASDDYREVKHVFIHAEPLNQPPLSQADCYTLFQATLEQRSGAESAGIELPDIDRWISKVEQHVANMVAAGFSAATINRQLDPRLNVRFPEDLDSMSLDEQADALDDFSTRTLDGAVPVSNTGHAAAQQELAASGIDPEAHLAADQASSAERQAEILQETGIDQDLQDLDSELKQSARDLYRLGIDLGSASVEVAKMSQGLAGLGLAFSVPGMLPEEHVPPPSRETIPARIQQGESFENVLLQGIDLSGLDLRKANLRQAILVEANLQGADLREANLTGAILCKANLTNARLADAQCGEADLTEAMLDSADLTGASLTQATLERCSALGAKFNRVSAAGANLTQADLSGAQFQQAQLAEADFSKCKLVGCSFRQSDMQQCMLTGAQGSHVDFTASNLTGARAAGGCDLPQANFQQVQAAESNWSDANLPQADFAYARMPGAFFSGACLEKANFFAARARRARFTKANLRQARLMQMDLYQAALDRADLSEADLRESNAFEADFFEAILEGTQRQHANLDRTRASVQAMGS